MMEKAISVTQLSNYVKSIFSNEEMLFNISVFGEIGAINNSRGVIYFTLKDENSLLNCVSFSEDAFKGFSVGDKVVVRGSFNYYSKMGKLSFAVNKVEAYGKGDLFLEFIKLKNKLEEEGLFDISHKKKLPKNIQKIGVVTSKTGAVFHDIMNVAHRRNSFLNIILSPCKVQGNDADISIIKAIDKLLTCDCDLIIVCRGGGSSEDLACYNSEALVRYVFDCDKFILSAVGHETDFTLIDFVSDLRAPTPSAAAELVTQDYSGVIDKIAKIKNQLISLKDRMIINKYDQLQFIKNTVSSNFKNLILKNENVIDKIKIKVEALNPISLANKGYVRVKKDGGNVLSRKTVKANDELIIEFIDGKVKTIAVEEV